MKGIDQRIADLPAEKLALLMERLSQVQRMAPAETEPPPILPRRRRGGARPLAFAQERLWFLAQLEPGSADYNVPVALRVRGTLAADAFIQVVDELLRRHEVLRASFRSLEGKPVQEVAASLRCVPPWADLRGLPAAAREAELLRLARREAACPFDLERAPLLRVRCLCAAAAETVLLLTLHHIVCDGWSLRLLVEEMVELYGAFAAGRPSPLPECALQYADFAEWQREQLQGRRLDELLRYWQGQLGDAPRELALRGREAEGGGGRAAEEVAVLSREASDRLAALGREEGATQFMVLAALFSALLYAWSGQEDLCIGANAANRGHLEAERLVGFFINQIVLRVRPRRGLAFRELLGQVRAATAGAYAHQDLPFEKLVEALGRDAGRGRIPLFQAKLEVQAAEDAPPLRIPGAQLEELEALAVALRCDLLLTAVSSPEGIVCMLGYDTGRLKASAVREMALDLSHIADVVAAAPDVRLDALAAAVSSGNERRLAGERDQLDRLTAATLKGVRRRSVQL